MRKPMIPAVAPRSGVDRGLAVKDGLREVRFNVKQGARKLMEAVEAATQPADAFGPLGKPLNLAVRTAANLLSNVDHAAVHLLAPDADFRSMSVPLCPSSAYFGAEAGSDFHPFTTDHHWRYRHWLALVGHDDVFVHEQAIALAAADMVRGGHTRPFLADGEAAVPADLSLRTSAAVVQAFLLQDVLTRPALLLDGSDVDDELPRLRTAGAVITVLAGEIAATIEAPTAHDRYLRALRLADEIAMADPAGWQSALAGKAAPEGLGRWFGFVLRHL